MSINGGVIKKSVFIHLIRVIRVPIILQAAGPHKYSEQTLVNAVLLSNFSYFHAIAFSL
jgi:hypothetical protein